VFFPFEVRHFCQVKISSVNSTIFFSIFFYFWNLKNLCITKLKKETFIINYLVIYLFKIYSGFLTMTPSRAGVFFFFPLNFVRLLK
jgi:hypothetical protein